MNNRRIIIFVLFLFGTAILGGTLLRFNNPVQPKGSPVLREESKISFVYLQPAIDGKALEIILSSPQGEFSICTDCGIVSQPVFSSDGSDLAMVAAHYEGDTPWMQLSVIDTITGVIRSVHTERDTVKGISQPVWNTTGNAILFSTSYLVPPGTDETIFRPDSAIFHYSLTTNEKRVIATQSDFPEFLHAQVMPVEFSLSMNCWILRAWRQLATPSPAAFFAVNATGDLVRLGAFDDLPASADFIGIDDRTLDYLFFYDGTYTRRNIYNPRNVRRFALDYPYFSSSELSLSGKYVVIYRSDQKRHFLLNLETDSITDLHVLNVAEAKYGAVRWVSDTSLVFQQNDQFVLYDLLTASTQPFETFLGTNDIYSIFAIKSSQ